MHKRPTYKVGFTFDDDLNIVTEVRCYVTDGKTGWCKDPIGQMEPFIVNAKSNTWHAKTNFFKDDNNQIRIKQRGEAMA